MGAEGVAGPVGIIQLIESAQVVGLSGKPNGGNFN